MIDWTELFEDIIKDINKLKDDLDKKEARLRYLESKESHRQPIGAYKLEPRLPHSE